MAKKKSHKIKFLKGEKIMWLMIMLLIVTIPVFKVYSKALLSETNINVEKLENNIKQQEGINEGLGMKINELASLDKIQEVAIANGLSYNNDNIKVIVNK